jgi:hypothetical protein
MNESLSSTNLRKDPKAEIQAAIATLNEFNQQNNISTQTPFINLVRLVADKFSENKQEIKKKQQDNLRDAIQTLKRNFALIPKLEEGSFQEQRFASFARSVIDSFNVNVDKFIKWEGLSVKERISAFLTTQRDLWQSIGKVELPKQISLQVDFQEKEKNNSFKNHITMISPNTTMCLKKIAKSTQINPTTSPLPKYEIPHLSWQAAQLFYMKVIALVEKHQILSHSEARKIIRVASVNSSIDPLSGLCTVACSLSPFPGQTITVTGAFEKDTISSFYSIPSKKASFHLTLNSTQTGFPHPLQCAGWALPDLLPQYPQRLEELDLFKSLFERKQKAAQGLHPNECLTDKAKKYLQLQTELFEEHKEAMITLHHDLSMAIAEAAEECLITNNPSTIIESFYRHLRQIHYPFEYLSNTHHLINDMFYKRLHDKVQTSWIECKLVANKELNGNLLNIQKILNQEYAQVREELQQHREKSSTELEKKTIDFILCMGQLLRPWQVIILQQFSEILLCASPTLSGYVEKIQSAAYHQLHTFLDFIESEELNQSPLNPNEVFQQIQKFIQSEIEIFNGKSDVIKEYPSTQIVQELKHYYRASESL